MRITQNWMLPVVINSERRDVQAAMRFADDCPSRSVALMADTRAALRELYRALRAGGRVVVWDIDWATVSMRPAGQRRQEEC